MDSVYRSMKQVTALLRAGKIDPVELYEQSVARMRRLEHLNAIITNMTDTAKIQAEQAKDRYGQGTVQPLLGESFYSLDYISLSRK